MSLLTKKLNEGGNSDWTPSLGWHEMRIVGICDLGKEMNPVSGKMQDKISVMTLIDELTESGVQKSKLDKYTASLHEKSGFVVNILKPAGVKVEALSETLGTCFRGKLAYDDSGKYLNIKTVDDCEKPLEILPGVTVPKFWLQDKDGKPTGYEFIVEDGISKELKTDDDY